MTTLPCGCTRGEFLCPTAERLWRASGNAYYGGDKNEYVRLLDEYETHFQQDTTTSKQETTR